MLSVWCPCQRFSPFRLVTLKLQKVFINSVVRPFLFLSICVPKIQFQRCYGYCPNGWWGGKWTDPSTGNAAILTLLRVWKSTIPDTVCVFKNLDPLTWFILPSSSSFINTIIYEEMCLFNLSVITFCDISKYLSTKSKHKKSVWHWIYCVSVE